MKVISADHIRHHTLVLISDEADPAHHKIITELANRGYRPKKIPPVLTTSPAIAFVVAEQSIASDRQELLKAGDERVLGTRRLRNVWWPHSSVRWVSKARAIPD